MPVGFRVLLQVDAAWLQERRPSARLLEALSRPGGRSYTVTRR